MGPTGKRITAALIAVALLVAATGFALSQSLTSTSDVRIVAQKLEDGRIEFGLEQDGERILPRTRFFPANAEVGRWLKSSPVEVEAAAPGAVDYDASPVSELRAEVSPGNNSNKPGVTNQSTVVWSAQHHHGLGYRVLLGLTGSSSHGLYNTGALAVYCDADAGVDDPLWVTVYAFPAILGVESKANLREGGSRASYAFSAYGETSRDGVNVTDQQVQIVGASDLWRKARVSEYITFSLPTGNSYIQVAFDLREAMKSPVVERLDRCGEY